MNGHNYVSNARDHKLICILFSQDNEIKTVIDITQKLTFVLGFHTNRPHTSFNNNNNKIICTYGHCSQARPTERFFFFS